MICPTEHDEQVNVMQRASYILSPEDYQLFHAIPNGGDRNIVVAKKLRAEGVRKGIPDLFLPVPRQGYHGLYIEMKRRKRARVSPEQEEIHRLLSEQGYAVYVCYGSDEALAVLENYYNS